MPVLDLVWEELPARALRDEVNGEGHHMLWCALALLYCEYVHSQCSLISSS